MNPKHYEWWNKAIADPHLIGHALPVNPNDPQCGYYRTRRGDQVAIWYDGDGLMVALEGSRAVDPVDIWSWCAKYPVSWFAYQQKRDTGRWPDDPPVIETKHTNIAAPAPAGIGHNMPPEGFETVQALALQEIELGERYLKEPITTHEQANQLGVWATTVTKLATDAERQRKAEKEPHLEAGRQVDAKWNPLIDELKALAKRIKSHLDGWMKEQDRLEQERQRKAREDADRIRIEAEAAAMAAAAAAEAIERADVGQALDKSVIDELQTATAEAERKQRELAEAERAAEARKVQAGRTGAKVSLREFTTFKITDRDVFLTAVKNDHEIEAALEKIARRFAKEGIAVAGMEIVRDRRVA